LSAFVLLLEILYIS